MEEVRLSAHVSLLRGSNGGAYPYGNPIRVRGGDTVVQIDSSLEAPATSTDLVLLSHYHEDHVVGLGETAAPLRIHARDLPAVTSWDEFCRYMDSPPEEIGEELRRQFRWSARPDATALHDDEVIDVGGGVRIRVVHLPGHTGGHCGFFVEPDGVFFLADVDLSSFGPLHADLESRLSDVRSSLARCAEIEAAVYTTYHHKGPYTERAEYLADLRRHTAAVEERGARIRDLLAQGVPADRLVGRGVIYRLDGRRPWYADAVEEVIVGQYLAEFTGGAQRADEIAR
ncbi:MBL fold metallo-hydrolase [Gordonia phosphorivorans]|uniref:MBL fold metallo-hydrolase n=1 Tax=Gordonia phosphorivorans TaxID=1056982 RepID=A0ABV6HE23_9ACTN